MKLRKVSAVAAAASAVALGTVLMFGGSATATAVVGPTVSPSPTPGQGNATICQDDPGTQNKVNLDGVTLLGANGPSNDSGPAGTGTVSADGKTLTVVINAGFTATGIVVKAGSEGYNLYTGPFVGEITVTGLTAPPTGAEGNIPQISHWFVCGDGTTTTTTTTTTTGTETTTTGTETTTTGTGTTTTSSGLPVTGGSLTGLIALGVALVAGGGMTLFFMRRRRAIAGE